MPFRLTGSDSPSICSPFASFSVGLSGLVATAACIPARRRAVAFAAAAGAAYTANVLTIKTMDFDHVPNPGIISP